MPYYEKQSLNFCYISEGFKELYFVTHNIDDCFPPK